MTPPRPGLVDAADGKQIEVEIWARKAQLKMAGQVPLGGEITQVSISKSHHHPKGTVGSKATIGEGFIIVTLIDFLLLDGFFKGFFSGG